MRNVKILIFVALLALPFQVFADSCGSAGRKVCYVWDKDWKKHPFGCDPDLVADKKGICRHPDCGRDRENRCKISVRALPCDLGLVLNPKDGKCYTSKEVGDALAKKAAAELCKTTLSFIRVGKTPPLFEHVRDALRKQAREVQQVAAKYDNAAKAFMRRNKQNYDEIERIGTLVKNDAKRIAALRNYFLSDDICVAKPFDARVAELRRMGVLPNLQEVSLASNSPGFSVISSAHARDDRSSVLTILWANSGAVMLAEEHAIGVSIDFTKRHAGVVVAFAVGAITNAKAAESLSISFTRAPSHDFASGRDIVVRGGAGEIVGIGGGAIFNEEVPGAIVGGFGEFGMELGISPFDLGAMVEWHAVLAPKSMGGAL